MKPNMESMVASYLNALRLLASFRDEQLLRDNGISAEKVWDEYSRDAEALRKLAFKPSNLLAAKKQGEVKRELPSGSAKVPHERSIRTIYKADIHEKCILRVTPTREDPFDLSFFGEVAEAKGKDFIIISYATPGLAANARKQISTKDLGWRLIGESKKEPSLKETKKEEVSKPFVPQDPTSLLVSIPSKVGTEEIKDFFERFGKVEFSAITTDGDHLILYEDARDAEDAKYCLKEGQMPGWILME